MLQEPIHVDDGEQRTDDTALWRATPVALAATHAPFPVAIPFLDWCLQPQLDQPQHIPANDASGRRFEEARVRDVVEVFRKTGVNTLRIPPANKPVHFLARIDRAATRPIPIS